MKNQNYTQQIPNDEDQDHQLTKESAQYSNKRVKIKKKIKFNAQTFVCVLAIAILSFGILSFVIQKKFYNNDVQVSKIIINSKKSPQNQIVDNNKALPEERQTLKKIQNDKITKDNKVNNIQHNQVENKKDKIQKDNKIDEPITKNDLNKIQVKNKNLQNINEKKSEQINKINDRNIQNKAPIMTKAPMKDYYLSDEQNRKRLASLGRRVQTTKKWLDLKYPGHDDLAQEQYKYYEQKYNISQYPQLPFCLVITSYNNVANQRYKKNLDALIMQNYSNYRAVVYEDVSTDGTGAALDKYMEEHPKFKSKITIIHNKIRTTSMNNLRRGAMQFCKPYQIYMLYDGDDELIGRQVFKVFNAYYQITGAWFVYSTTLLSQIRVGYSTAYRNKAIKQNSYRNQRYFQSQHFKTFYNKLFQLVKDQDLRDDDGDYYKFTSDQAICFPMLEMAHKRVAFLPQMTYLYNTNTGLNDGAKFAKEQEIIEKKIRKKMPYKQIPQLILIDQKKNQK